jgi:hypothetical protein
MHQIVTTSTGLRGALIEHLRRGSRPKENNGLFRTASSWPISPRRTAHGVRNAHSRFADVSFLCPRLILRVLPR